MTVATYYRHRIIRDRIVEFLGGSSLEDATAIFLTGGADGSSLDYAPVMHLEELLERGYEIERSLQDRERLIVDFDIDYENFDSAVEAYTNPARAFQILEPVVCGALEILASAEIRPLHLISGKGHHLVWSIDRTTRAFHQLATLGDMSMNSATGYKRAHNSSCFAPDPDLDRAFIGLGLLLEYVTHRILDVTQPHSPVPVMATAIEVGPGQYGYREIVSLDISEYGDAASNAPYSRSVQRLLETSPPHLVPRRR